MDPIRFNHKDRPDFYKVLRKRVNKHFKDNNISKYANTNMVLKTIFMVSLYIIPFILMLTVFNSSTIGVTAMWFLMSLGMSGIGLAVMHDANHGAYSKNQNVNKALGYLLNIVGGSDLNWRIQHNVLHHTYTNIENYDEDIDTQVFRMSPTQKHKPLHRFQAYYATFFYGLMTFYWLVSKDIEGVVRYNKKDLLKGQGTSYRKALITIIIQKIVYVSVFFILPLFILNVSTLTIILGFLMMHFIVGVILAYIFQPAHVIEETEFYVPDENLSVESNWAIHQLRTTSDFAQNNKLFSWYVGGLNFQVEHHLFPNICHVHYKDISHIVKETAEEYGVPYYSHPTFFAALKSHFSVLHKFGKGETV